MKYGPPCALTHGTPVTWTRRGATLPSGPLGGKSLTSGADYHAGATESGSRTRVEKRKGWTALGGALFGLAVGLLWAWLSPMTQPIGISFLFAFVGFSWPGCQRSSIRRRIASTIFSIAIVVSAASRELSRTAARVRQPVTDVIGCAGDTVSLHCTLHILLCCHMLRMPHPAGSCWGLRRSGYR